MRFLLVTVTILALSVPCNGYDRARILLSDHAVVCSPGTPAVAVRHLVETWGALVCVVQSDALRSHEELLPWVSVQLPSWSDPATARDSLLAWKERLHLGAALVTDDPALATAAAGAGLRVFTQVGAFQKGAVAIPTGRGYVFYAGPAPVFFERAGTLEDLLTDTLKSHREAGWSDLGAGLAAAFRGSEAASNSRWEYLFNATLTADSLHALESADSRTRIYAERWRHCLAWWLSPVWSVDTLKLYTGQRTDFTLGLRVAEAVVTLTGLRITSNDALVTWSTPLPVELSPETPTDLAGAFQSEHPGRRTWAVLLECRFGPFRFSRTLALPVEVQATLQAEFVPPVLLVDNEHTRTDPDFTIGVARGELELVNRSSSPLRLQLAWQAEAPIVLSATATDVTLAPGERQRKGFTLSIPKELKYKEYGFGAELSAPAGEPVSVRGQLWKETPRRTGSGSLGAVGCSEAWLSALPALGVTVTPLTPGSIGAAELKTLSALLIHEGASAPTQSEVNAVSAFTQSGGVVIVDLATDALAWLPWPVTTVSRPGPFAASFYKDDLDWWLSPNGLVGGCFAAAKRDSVLTLTPGERGWEPLLVDDHGKGFMYRQRHGRGWYVLIHTGWSPRLEQLERRAHLGLFNLMSVASR